MHFPAKYSLLGAALLHFLISFGQSEPIQGELGHTGNGSLSILQIHPDSILFCFGPKKPTANPTLDYLSRP